MCNIYIYNAYICECIYIYLYLQYVFLYKYVCICIYVCEFQYAHKNIYMSACVYSLNTDLHCSEFWSKKKV